MEVDMKASCFSMLLMALASSASAADIPGGPKIGDRLAAYTPAKSLNLQGKVKCETC
jgi:hypothetical protein